MAGQLRCQVNFESDSVWMRGGYVRIPLCRAHRSNTCAGVLLADDATATTFSLSTNLSIPIRTHVANSESNTHHSDIKWRRGAPCHHRATCKPQKRSRFPCKTSPGLCAVDVGDAPVDQPWVSPCSSPAAPLDAAHRSSIHQLIYTCLRTRHTLVCIIRCCSTFFIELL